MKSLGQQQTIHFSVPIRERSPPNPGISGQCLFGFDTVGSVLTYLQIDALKAYTHRHLRRDETYRTNCFIKMILQLEKGDFHPVAVQRKAEPYYKKLLAVPLHKAKQDHDLEIIPYETLWTFILESLEPDRKTKVQDR
jgi:hypothetical protein